MVSLSSKLIVGAVGLGAAFLIIRGAGQKLDNLTNPFRGLPLPPAPSLTLPSFDFKFPDITNIFKPPVVLGKIEDGEVSPDLKPNEEERVRGNVSILEGLGFTPEQIRNILSGLPNGQQQEADVLDPIIVDQDSLTPAQQFAQEERGRDFSVPTNVEGAQFRGFGPSFVGGSVSEMPISKLSLGDIIDRFGVSASQAADIRARASNDFGNFDFGTNTGSGIGSVVAEDSQIRNSLPNIGAVSDPRFEGKTPEEIALELTGGLINNF